MAHSRALTCGLTVLLVLAAALPSSAGEVLFSIRDGRVTLIARDATISDILAVWEKEGRTTIVARERVQGSVTSLDIRNEPEADALATVLRNVTGYIAAKHAVQPADASIYRCIVINPAPAAMLSPVSMAAATPTALGNRPQVQRRTLADGRTVTLVENPNRPGEMMTVDDDNNDQSQLGGVINRPPPGSPGSESYNPDPLVGPAGRGLPLPAGATPGSYTGPAGPSRGQMTADPFSLQYPTGATQPGPQAAPTAPGSATRPGVVLPPPKPPGPPKDPGGETK